MLIDQIRDRLSCNANEDKAEAMEAYLKGHFKCYGIPSVIRRQATKDLIKQSRNLSISAKYELAIDLWREPYRESHYTAMDILAKSEKKVNMSHIKLTEHMITNQSWWDTVDWLASHLIGQIIKGNQVESQAHLMRWLDSDNIWLNRTCLIYQLFYKEETNFGRLQDYILILYSKQEFFIQKAIGWSLRQYSRTDPIAVEEFVTEHPELSNLAQKEAMRLINKNR